MIAVDIGNTNITVVQFEQKKLKKTSFLSRHNLSQKSTSNAFKYFSKNEPLVICSVVPEVNIFFRKLKFKTYFVEEDLRVPIKCSYKKNEVGADRLVAAYAARKILPSVRMVIDFGTAITVDFLSEKGSYQGGLILPGISSTLQTFKKCSLLPSKIEIAKPRQVIPKNTLESINSGLREGFSQMLNGLVDKYSKKLKIIRKEAILITGGDFLRLKPGLNFNFRYEKHLIPRGLFYLYAQLVQA